MTNVKDHPYCPPPGTKFPAATLNYFQPDDGGRPAIELNGFLSFSYPKPGKSFPDTKANERFESVFRFSSPRRFQSGAKSTKGRVSCSKITRYPMTTEVKRRVEVSSRSCAAWLEVESLKVAS